MFENTIDVTETLISEYEEIYKEKVKEKIQKIADEANQSFVTIKPNYGRHQLGGDTQNIFGSARAPWEAFISNLSSPFETKFQDDFSRQEIEGFADMSADHTIETIQRKIDFQIFEKLAENQNYRHQCQFQNDKDLKNFSKNKKLSHFVIPDIGFFVRHFGEEKNQSFFYGNRPSKNISPFDYNNYNKLRSRIDDYHSKFTYMYDDEANALDMKPNEFLAWNIENLEIVVEFDERFIHSGIFHFQYDTGDIGYQFRTDIIVKISLDA